MMHEPDSEIQFGLINTDCSVNVYSAWFSEAENELISSLNRLFDPEMWSAESYGSLKLSSRSISTISLTSPQGEKVKVAYWYVVNKKVFTNAAKAKLYQIALKMRGKSSSGSVWVVASTKTLTEQTVSYVLSNI